MPQIYRKMTSASARLPRRFARHRLASALALCLTVWAPMAAADPALPSGGEVIAGSAVISASPNGLAVTQSTDRAVIDWNSFSVGQGAMMSFHLPSPEAAVLNRVTGSIPSTIAGTLSANGQVFLVNPNGIAITPTGAVRVGGGFVASTLDVSNADFLAGRLRFQGASAAGISHAGTSGSIQSSVGAASSRHLRD